MITFTPHLESKSVDCHKQNITGVHYKIPANLEFAGKVLEKFSLYLSKLNMNYDSQNNWKVILMEGLTNAIVHGNQSDPNSFVNIHWALYGKELVLEIEDKGKGPPNELKENPQLPEDLFQTNGRGLYMIKSLSTSWEHWHNDCGYKVIIKNFHDEIEPDFIDHEMIDKLLEEISQNYENLNAFYSMGFSLIASINASDFINETLKDLNNIIPCSNIFFNFTDSLHSKLIDDLSMVDFHNKDHNLYLDNNNQDNIWESIDDLNKDSALNSYPFGFQGNIKIKDRVLGKLTLVRHQDQGFFKAVEINTIRTFSDLIGIVIAQENNKLNREKTQRIIREIEIAKNLQKDLIPVPPILDTNYCYAYAQRKSAREVSGDYVDIINKS